MGRAMSPWHRGGGTLGAQGVPEIGGTEKLKSFCERRGGVLHPRCSPGAVMLQGGCAGMAWDVGPAGGCHP